MARKASSNKRGSTSKRSSARKKQQPRKQARKEPILKKSEIPTEITVIEGTCWETGTDEAPRPRGRPTDYTPEIADEICARISEGETLLQICRDEHMPNRTTVLGWVRHNYHGFSNTYTRARELQRDAWADEIVDISDNGSNDWIKRELKGGRIQMVLNDEAVSRARLRCDNRRWLLEKLDPRFRKLDAKAPAGGDAPPDGQSEADAAQDHLQHLAARFAGGLKVINGGAK